MKEEIYRDRLCRELAAKVEDALDDLSRALCGWDLLGEKVELMSPEEAKHKIFTAEDLLNELATTAVVKITGRRLQEAILYQQLAAEIKYKEENEK